MGKKHEIIPKYTPFIKWVGGKRAIADQILGLAGVNTKEPVTQLNVYVEPFLGGGAMFFHLKNLGLIGPDTKVFLSDMNKSLIHTYQVIRDRCSDLIEKLEEHSVKHHQKDLLWIKTEDEKLFREQTKKNKPKLEYDDYYYYYVRDNIYNIFHKKLKLSANEKIDLAAAFIYLNRTGFNGMYRENAAGIMNIPRGRYTNPSIVNKDVLFAARDALDGVSINNFTYQQSVRELSKIIPGTLFYFDPPYYNTFTDYNGGGFGKQEQRDLAKLAKDLTGSGAKVIISNSSNLFTRRLYKNYGLECEYISAARNINSDGQGRSKVKEIIAYNKI